MSIRIKIPCKILLIFQFRSVTVYFSINAETPGFNVKYIDEMLFLIMNFRGL